MWDGSMILSSTTVKFEICECNKSIRQCWATKIKIQIWEYVVGREGIDECD